MTNNDYAQKLLKNAGIDINDLSNPDYFKIDFSDDAVGILHLLSCSNILTVDNVNLVLEKLNKSVVSRITEEPTLYSALHILYSGSPKNSDPKIVMKNRGSSRYTGRSFYQPPPSALTQTNFDIIIKNRVPIYAAALIRLFIDNGASEFITTHVHILDKSSVDNRDDKDRRYVLADHTDGPSESYRFDRACFKAERDSITGFKILRSARILNTKTEDKLLQKIKQCRSWLSDADDYLRCLKRFHKNDLLTESLFMTVSDHENPVEFTNTYFLLLKSDTKIEYQVWLDAISNIECTTAFLKTLPLLHQQRLLTAARLHDIQQLKREEMAELFVALRIVQSHGVQLSSKMYDMMMTHGSSRYAAALICLLVKRKQGFNEQHFNIVCVLAQNERASDNDSLWTKEFYLNEINRLFNEYERLGFNEHRFTIENNFIDQLYPKPASRPRRELKPRILHSWWSRASRSSDESPEESKRLEYWKF